MECIWSFFVKCSHFLPEDTVAFLLKHLNLLLFSTKVRAVTVTTDEKFYTFKVSSQEITHYSDLILIKIKKQKTDEDLRVRPNIHLYLQFTKWGVSRGSDLRTNVKPLFYFTTVTAIMHVGPEGMYEQWGPTQDVHTNLHLKGERVTVDFLQAIPRSHSTTIASAVS